MSYHKPDFAGRSSSETNEGAIEIQLDEIALEQARISASLKTLSNVLEILAEHIPDSLQCNTCLYCLGRYPAQVSN